MDCSTPGFPVLHYLLEFAQTNYGHVQVSVLPQVLGSSFFIYKVKGLHWIVPETSLGGCKASLGFLPRWVFYQGGKDSFHTILWTSLVVQLVQNLPAMQETQVWTLGWEDLLKKGMATHSHILAWRIPWTDRGARQAHGVTNSWTWPCDLRTHTHTHTILYYNLSLTCASHGLIEAK